jgi:hypothetical protein
MRPLRLLLLVAVLVGPAWGAQADGPDSAGIQGVIARQFDAFRAKDPSTAFSFASPMIQSMFGSPENFGRMVQGGYPMIWAPSEVEYRDVHVENGLIFQRVRVRDGSGQDFYFDYEMIESPDGWKINGVYPVRTPGVGV